MNKTIDKILSDAISSGSQIGASCLVFKDGKELYSGFYGFSDRENNIPMKRDNIFRLFSLSKPITSAAAMILTDKKIISPEDNVSKYFPQYEHMNFVSGEEIRECGEPLKIKHLLSMTSGIPYADNWGVSVCEAAKLFDKIIASQKNGNELTTSEICAMAADIPLMYKPGKNWYYGISADIIGGIIEKASGMRYGEFLKKNIFEPLGMTDTGFYIPEEKYDRLCALYSWGENGLVRDNGLYLGLTDYKKAPGFESGGAGLVSTIEDYSKFACCLANRGEFNGVRLFSEKTFDYMITPQLGQKQQADMWDRLTGYNYGNFMRIMTEPKKAQYKTCKGEFGWDGWTGTYFCADAENKIAVLYFTQICGAGSTTEALKTAETVYKFNS